MFKQKMDKFIDEYCKLYKFSGSFRVTKNDEVIYERFMGYSDVENKTPINKNSKFNFYSLSKPFCAIGLLKLYDKGLVDLDKHPGEYIPEAKGFGEAVTIRQILHHTSGLPDMEQTEDFFESMDLTIRENIKILSKSPSFFKPGQDVRYANINFNIPALIIENITGMSYAEYMTKEVFEPLDMKTADFDGKDCKNLERVKSYEIDGSTLVEVKPNSHLYNMFGAGDIVGTLDDVYALNNAIKNKLLLKPETWEMVLTPGLGSFGMGCRVFDWHGKKRITHNGGSIGFRTLHVQLPEDDFDFILLSNSGYGNSREAFSEAVYEAYYGKDNEKSKKFEMDAGYIKGIVTDEDEGEALKPKKPERIELSPDEEKELIGSYGTYEFLKENDYYKIIKDDKKELHCYHCGDKVFANLYIDEKYQITRDEDGDFVLFGEKKTSK